MSTTNSGDVKSTNCTEPQATGIQSSPAVGLIGVGGYGSLHLQFLSSLQSEGLLRLVAVSDSIPERLQKTHERLTASGVRWYRNYLQLLSEEKSLDLVVIATPIPLHEEMIREALERTTAAIYMEKPPVPTLAQLRSLIQADTARRVHVGFQMVTWRAFRQLKEWINEGRFGTIRRITAGAVWPRDDSYYCRTDWVGRLITDRGEPVFDGPATNALAHLTHNIMFLAGEGAGNFARPSHVRGEFYRARPIESYDAACLAGRFASGIEYTLAVAHCSREQQEFVVRIQGDQGEARVISNGRRIEADFADSQDFDDPYDSELHRQTLLRMGENRAPVTSLADCLGYSEATFGGLMSAGMINEIPQKFIDAGEIKQERVYQVEGLACAVRQTIETGLMWSEQNIPWAQSPAETLDSETIQTRAFDLGALVKSSKVVDRVV
ncbi:MAG: Gfo/Idh/MocA family oxidoreductase [Chthoniobacteraceae bacterium]